MAWACRRRQRLHQRAQEARLEGDQHGNANQFVYDETFVVFKDTDDEAAARLLAADLGQGRVVRSYARYSYEGNLLVVIGKDYKPY